MKKVLSAVGIDEVGRGPVAGPVSVCAVRNLTLKEDAIDSYFPYLTDSKKLTPKRREHVMDIAHSLQKEAAIDFSVVSIEAAVIDREGIQSAIRQALGQALSDVASDPEEVLVFLDGGLKAPRAYTRQETIIRGDGTVPIISLASVIAKVSRDAHMETLAAEYPEYGFDRHRGYGTRAHFDAIRTHGMCPEHRKTFLTKVIL